MMFKLKEILSLILAIILFGFIISFLKGMDAFIIALEIAAIIILVSVFAKKLIAYYVGAQIEEKIWQWQRWGWYERSYLKTPWPMGIILPFIMIWISYPYGFLKFLTFLQFDVRATSARTAKKIGLYRYTEMTEWHIALIAGIGAISTLLLAIIAYFLGYPLLARYSIYFSIWSLVPFGQLDGTKLFFGSRLLWYVLVIISLIGLGYALFLT